MTTPSDKQTLRATIQVAINSCKDVTTLGRFAPTVDPVRWVEQLQAHLESAVAIKPKGKRRTRKRSAKRSNEGLNITIGDYS